MSINEAKQEVERLLRSGEKIEAVKFIKETLNVSLLDAKNLVEAVENEMAAGGSVEPTTTSSTPGGPLPSIEQSALSTPQKTEVQRLLLANKKIEAVKYIREQFNTGLKESKDIVEVVERELGPMLNSTQQGKGCAKGIFKAIAVIFGFVGILFLGAAAMVYYYISTAIEQSERTTGRVTAMRSNENGNTTAPDITFQWRGEERVYHSKVYSSPPDYQIGEELTIFVNQENPEEVIIDSFTDRWLIVTVIGCVGAFFILTMVLFLFVSRKF